MAVSAVWRRVYFLAPCPSEPKEQTAAHRRDALCPSTKIQKQVAFGIRPPTREALWRAFFAGMPDLQNAWSLAYVRSYRWFHWVG